MNKFFTDKTDALWTEMTEAVKTLCAKYGEDKVVSTIKEDRACDPSMISVKDGRVEFQGTMDDIAASVDGLTAELEHCAGYRWIAWSDDGSCEDRSTKVFKTEAEAYDDMRDAALEKMKWNTEHDEDFEDCTRIRYEVKFSPDTISHSSYSGVYFWHVVREGAEFAEEERKRLGEKVWGE